MLARITKGLQNRRDKARQRFHSLSVQCTMPGPSKSVICKKHSSVGVCAAQLLCCSIMLIVVSGCFSKKERKTRFCIYTWNASHSFRAALWGLLCWNVYMKSNPALGFLWKCIHWGECLIYESAGDQVPVYRYTELGGCFFVMALHQAQVIFFSFLLFVPDNLSLLSNLKNKNWTEIDPSLTGLLKSHFSKHYSGMNLPNGLSSTES